MKVKHPTDIITFQMTRGQQWQLERIQGAIYSVADVSNNDDYQSFYGVLNLIAADLMNVMDEIERLNREKKDGGEK